MIPKISFFLRSNKDKIKSYCLYCRISYNGTKCEFSLKEKLKKCEWIQKTQSCKSTGQQSNYINNLIDELVYKIKRIALSGEFISARDLINEYKKTLQPGHTLFYLIELYISHFETEIKPTTKTNHLIKANNLKLYQAHTKNTFYATNFDVSTARNFIEWFCTTKKTNNITTANRNVAFYKCVLNWAVQSQIIEKHALVNFCSKKDKRKKTKFLTIEELNTVENFNPFSTLLQRVKDLFVFQCYTGLSYADLYGNWKIETKSGYKVITGKRIKNNQLFYTPLFEEAEKLLLKYNFKLPVFANATYNRLLKEIMSLCAIDKTVTTHVARKTFVTLQDAKGWSRESIARMCGHNSIKTTEQYYLGETNLRVDSEFLKRAV